MAEPSDVAIEQFVKSYFRVTRSWTISESDFQVYNVPPPGPSVIWLPKWRNEEVEEINKLCLTASQQREHYICRTNKKQMLTSDMAQDLLNTFYQTSLDKKPKPDIYFLKNQIREAIDRSENEEDAALDIQRILRSKTFYLKLRALSRAVFRFRQAFYDVIKWLIGFGILFVLFERVERTTDTILLAVVALLYVRNRLQLEEQGAGFKIILNALEQEFLTLRWILKAEMPEESWNKVRKQEQEGKKLLALNYVRSFAALPCIGLIFWKVLGVIGVL